MPQPHFVRGPLLHLALFLILASPALATDAWSLKADPPAASPAWNNIAGKSITVPQGPGPTHPETVRPATGTPFLLTGHHTGSTVREVWSLTDCVKVATLNGRFDTLPGNLALSPDGKLVTVTRKKSFTALGVDVWSTESGKKVNSLEIGPASDTVVWSGFVSPSTLLTIHNDDKQKTKLRLIDCTAGTPAIEIPGPANPDSALISLSPGGHLLAFGLNAGGIAIIDLTEKQSGKIQHLPKPKDYGQCRAVRFSPEGTEIAALYSEDETTVRKGTFQLAAWNLGDGQLSIQLQDVHLGPAAVVADRTVLHTGCDWLPDGSALLIGNRTLVDRDTGYAVWRLKLPSNGPGEFAPVFLGTDHLLIPQGTGQDMRLVASKLPWPEIDSALKTLQSKAPAWLRPGDRLSLQFEFGGLRFQKPEQLQKQLSAHFEARLHEDGFEIAQNQPVTLKVAYAESSGSKLQKHGDGFPFPAPPAFRPPGFPRRRGLMSDEATGTGTAFIVHSDGYLLTCAHVVGAAPSVQVKIGEKTYHGRVVAKNVALDFALLKIEVKNLPTLPLADSSTLELGEEVRAFGYPISSVLGDSIKATRGTLSGLVKKDSHTMFQVDASINPGNSGGPLVNDLGEVVGINSAKLVGTEVDNVGFSIPINDVKAMLKEQKVTFSAKGAANRLTGPELIKRVTPAVAFVTSSGGTELEPPGDNSVVVTRIACLISLLVKDHPEPVWTEQIVVDPHSLRVQGQLTEEKARSLAFETFTQQVGLLSLPYFVSKDAVPVVLPVITDLSIPANPQPPVPATRKTRRGLSN